MPQSLPPADAQLTDAAAALDEWWRAATLSLRIPEGPRSRATALAEWHPVAGVAVALKIASVGEFLPPAFMATVVLGTSVVQALAEYGENPRYFIPSQPLVIACTAMALAAFVHSFRGQRSFRRSLGRDTV